MTKRQLCYSLRSTLHSTEYITDVPNIAFGPKISRECMGWRDAGHVDRCSTWRMYDQSRSRISGRYTTT